MTTGPDERIELRTERLVLRPFRLGDADDVFEYASDPEWPRYLPGIPDPYTRRHAHEFVARGVLASWATNPTFAIVLDSRVIGGTGLTVQAENEVGALGYAIAKAHWGKGLTTEAAQAVVDWGFEQHRLAKVYAVADLRNQASWRVMEKLGMTREGVLSRDRTR